MLHARVSRDAVLQSVALERLGEEPPKRVLDPMFGARWVMVQRRLEGPADTVFERLDDWLDWNDGNLPPKGRWKSLAAELGVTPEALYRTLAQRNRDAN